MEFIACLRMRNGLDVINALNSKEQLNFIYEHVEKIRPKKIGGE